MSKVPVDVGVAFHFNMKIVKQLDDPEYFHTVFNRPGGSNEYWKWGLGDDGNVYCTNSVTIAPPAGEWCDLGRLGYCKHLTLKKMKYLIKEFGHLLVFL
jgi:hypothetical protein